MNGPITEAKFLKLLKRLNQERWLDQMDYQVFNVNVLKINVSTATKYDEFYFTGTLKEANIVLIFKDRHDLV